MKLLRYGVVAGTLATLGLVGCSSSDKTPGSTSDAKTSSVSFHLKTSNGVQIDTINYDLTTSGGVDVVNGALPVPDDQSTNIPLLGIQSLGAGTYNLEFTATSSDGKYTCDSGKVGFNLAAGQNLVLPQGGSGPIVLQCTTTVQVDNTGSVTADVSVVTSTQQVNSVIETFTYGPRTANGHKDATDATKCDFAPITIKVANSDTSIHYSWTASPDGSFSPTGMSTSGTYNCASGGDKTLTVTATKGAQTSTKSITVTCNAAPCSFVCGDGIVQTGEQCDEGANPSPRCTNCQITPVCGDGFVDAPETCEPPNTAACDATCHLRTATCGDGFVDPATEQCDNGAANSNTTPNACRTNCKNPSCGDGVVDTGEQCDPPTAGSCSSTCQTIVNQDAFATCEPCIEANTTSAYFQTTYVDGDPLALAVEKCVVDAKCFNPLPAFCFCGITDQTAMTTDVGVCKQTSFVANGPCASDIKNGMAPSGITSNSDINDNYFKFSNSSGAAMGTLNATFAHAPECQTKCF